MLRVTTAFPTEVWVYVWIISAWDVSISQVPWRGANTAAVKAEGKWRCLSGEMGRKIPAAWTQASFIVLVCSEAVQELLVSDSSTLWANKNSWAIHGAMTGGNSASLCTAMAQTCFSSLWLTQVIHSMVSQERGNMHSPQNRLWIPPPLQIRHMNVNCLRVRMKVKPVFLVYARTPYCAGYL